MIKMEEGTILAAGTVITIEFQKWTAAGWTIRWRLQGHTEKYGLPEIAEWRVAHRIPGDRALELIGNYQQLLATFVRMKREGPAIID